MPSFIAAIFVIIASLSFSTSVLAQRGHGHCLKTVKGKEIELKRVKSKAKCKKRGGEWHEDGDGHDHGHDHKGDHGHDHKH